MKKTLSSVLALALVLGTSVFAKAQDEKTAEMKPVVVVSFAGYAELKRDLEYLGTVSGNPDMAASLEQLLMFFTQNQGLAGLDKDRPWGLALGLGAEGGQPAGLAFLPVSDLQKLLSSLAALVGEPEDQGDGVWAIKRDANSVFVKETEGWAFLSQTAEGLSSLPEDPLKLLNGLEEQYDLAVRVSIQNIPQELRDMAADLLKRQVEQGLQQAVEEDEDDGQAELQAKLARAQLETLAKAINELDQITIGWAIDSEGKRTFLDLNVTALEDSDTARQLALVSNSASKFAGFLLPEAALTMHLNSVAAEEDVEQSLGMLVNLRAHVMQEIADDEDLPDEKAKALIQDLVGDVLEVAEETLKGGRINAGLSVVGEGPMTVVAGGLVADGAKLEEVAKKLAELAESEGESELEVKLDVDEKDGVKFHTVKAPLPDDEVDEDLEKVKAIFGETLLITLGFGEDSLYVGLGDDGVETIKQVMDQSEADAAKELPPMQLTLSLAPLLKIAMQQEDANPSLQMLAEALEEGGLDHVKITVNPIENGVQYQIEGEEGVIKLIGSAAGQASAAGGAGGF